MQNSNALMTTPTCSVNDTQYSSSMSHSPQICSKNDIVYSSFSNFLAWSSENPYWVWDYWLSKSRFWSKTSIWNLYHTALNFQGSKFSWMVTFEDFIEIISRIHCRTRTLHTVCQKFLLKYFHELLKIHEIFEIKDPWKFSAIQYVAM